MNLSRAIKNLTADPAIRDQDARRAAIKLAAELSAARAKIASLEAENMGLRDAVRGVNRHEGLAKDFTAIREAERIACSALVDSLGLHEAAKRIMERE